MVWTIEGLPPTELMFFQTTPSQPPLGALGPLLREARDRLGWSPAEAALAARLSQEEIISMEEGQSLSPDMARIHAVTYARALGLDPLDLKDDLPPMPELAPKNRQYLSNYSRPLQPPFRFNLELLAPLAPIGRASVYLLLLATLLSTWGMMRQLSRVRSIPWITSTSRLPSFLDR
jgi:transcriptional regulator with XRE-family HTH domain